MESVERGDDLVLSRIAYGELHGPLVRFGSAVDEQRAVQVTRGYFGYALCQLGLFFHIVKIGRVGHAGDLGLYGGDPLGMRVSQGVYSYACHQIEIFLSLCIVEIRSFSMGERDLYASVVLEKILLAHLFDFFEIHVITS